ncbi:sigma-70 family RNA polymerase sigma factor [bacterium]|nr:sigma-70 family RNA polymerase sigma factor [bacterium]
MINCDKKTDIELVQLTLKNEKYFLCLMKKYETKLLNYTKRISNFNHEDAEDILQDVFIKVYQNLNNFDPNLKFSSWIYRITHNEVISKFRKNKARPEKSNLNIEIQNNILNNITTDLNIEKKIDNELLKKQIFNILSLMDVKYREILILKFLEHKDYNEISDILKKPKGTVATLINRAKKQFKIKQNKYNINL